MEAGRTRPTPRPSYRAQQLTGWRSEPFGDTEAAQVVEESITGKPNKHRAAAGMSLNSGNLGELEISQAALQGLLPSSLKAFGGRLRNGICFSAWTGARPEHARASRRPQRPRSALPPPSEGQLSTF